MAIFLQYPLIILFSFSQHFLDIPTSSPLKLMFPSALSLNSISMLKKENNKQKFKLIFTKKKEKKERVEGRKGGGKKGREKEQ